jgi:hypothetical protein
MAEPSAARQAAQPLDLRALLAAAQAGVDPNPGSVEQYRPGTRGNIADFLRWIGGGVGANPQSVESLIGGMDFVPLLGEAVGGGEAGEDIAKGNYLSGGAQLAASLIPGGPKVVKAIKGGNKALDALPAGRAALAEAMAAPGTRGMMAAEPLEGGRISQRFPTGKTTEDPLTDNLLINTDVLRSDPAKMQQTADVIRGYPSTTNEMKEMAPDEMVNAFIEQLRGNYNAMYDLMPPAAAERAGKWYLGANRIANERAAEVGVKPEAAAGVYAALSPQKDWFMNVYLGDQVLRTLDRNPKVTQDMLNVAEGIKPFQTDDARDMLAASLGRRIQNLDPEAQAAAVRLWDETYNPRTYQKITPEGDYGDFVTNKDSTLGAPAWNTQNAIEKAVQAAQSGGDMSVISPLMGNKHKVRNFYNNIAAPELGAMFGDITADTHHIGAGLFRPLTGNSPEVLQGLLSGSAGIAKGPQSAVTGLQGLYPLYADATRLAAADRGIPTRQMQSVPWEAMRALFPREFRTAANQSKIDDFWRLFGAGEIDADEARRRTIEAAGGFTPPKW